MQDLFGDISPISAGGSVSVRNQLDHGGQDHGMLHGRDREESGLQEMGMRWI